MKPFVCLAALLFFSSWPRPVQAERTWQPAFAEAPELYRIGSEARTDRWSHFVTRGVSLLPITGSARVEKYVRLAPGGDAQTMRLSTRGNYVVLVRRVPADFARATQLRWNWHVVRDTPRGRLGERPDDQAIQVILIFRQPATAAYQALSFAWTKDARRDNALYFTRIPQDGFPRVPVAVRRLQNGPQPARAEQVDIPRAFLQAATEHGPQFAEAGTEVPDLFGIVLFGESSDQRPPVDQELMSTEAWVSGLELVAED
ncbi:MAG: DUF3047 domain-containing protein [Pirellulaceae bacterium]|nr:DUF3047 domain-containing protein [Pirellulaceae bacterium]